MKKEDFFNLSLDIMCIIDENNEIENVNKACEDILGYKVSEIKGKKLTEFVHPEDVDRVLINIHTLKKNKEVTNSVSRYLKKNGNCCYLEWRAAYHNRKIYATAREIEEKIQIKNKLKSSEENFKNFFATTDSMVFVGDKNSNIIYVNEKVEERLHYNKEELIGKNFLDMHEKDKREEAGRIISNILKTKKGKCPLPLVTKEGKLVPVETRLWIGEWNDRKCIYATSKDLTIELENLQKFNKIFENNPTIMLISSYKTGKITEVNETFLENLEYQKEEIIGKKIQDFKIIPKESNLLNIINTSRYNSKIKNIEVTYKTKNGKERYGLLSKELIENQEKKYFLNSIIDITEQKEISKLLEYKNQFLSILMEIIFKFINYPTGKSYNFINESLETIGEFVKADRVYTFDYDFKNQITSNTYEWCKEGVEPQIDYLQNISIEIIRSWVKKHKEGRIIRIPEVSKYKSEDKVKEILESQNIKSLLSVPMMDEGECVGFVGFDSVLKYKKYDKTEIDLLKLFAQTIVDIRKKDKKEKELIKSLEEKSTLMREIHHRVKNNLQLVSSLLYLQSSYIKNPKVKKALKDTENRVKSMAILHEKIYRAKEINELNFKEYIEEIIKELLKSYKIDKRIKLYADIEDVDLNIDIAINCGLIVNELITNSLQHAFNNRDKGEIKILIYAIKEEVFIEISDNGEGFNKKFECLKNKSLGLQIVESLVMQLKGSIKKEEVKGTKFIIKFKIIRRDENE
ncbi:MAG: PAS domain S-box protein [Bacillota bacterium]|nr:PAS domain S-box protein [Bacillota bacterium]